MPSGFAFEQRAASDSNDQRCVSRRDTGLGQVEQAAGRPTQERIEAHRLEVEQREAE